MLAAKGWQVLVNGIKEATGVDLTEPFQTIGGKECTWCAVADSYLQIGGRLLEDGIKFADAISRILFFSASSLLK